MHEAARLVMPRPKVASGKKEEDDEEQGGKERERGSATLSITGSGTPATTTKLSRFPPAGHRRMGQFQSAVYEERL